MYVITGASGNVGSGLARKLIKEGKQVRVIARDAKRLSALTEKGADPRAGSLFDTDFLYDAFRHATAVFTMIPPNTKADNVAREQDTIGASITTALRLSNVRKIVNLSSMGGEVAEGTGPIAGLHRQEERLNQLENTDVLHLRPAYFMENFLFNIPIIKQMGINGGAFRSDMAMPVIATRDIAAFAADRLIRLDFQGKSVADLLGARDLTMADATRIIGEAIGRPDLKYVQFPYEDAEKGMIQSGISPDVARAYNEMARALNEGLVVPAPRTPQNTTSTTFEEFARNVFAPAFAE